MKRRKNEDSDCVIHLNPGWPIDFLREGYKSSPSANAPHSNVQKIKGFVTSLQYYFRRQPSIHYRSLHILVKGFS